MMQIKVENGMAKIFTPYNAKFVEKIKNIGGRKWNSYEKCWMIPESEIETARQYMKEVFGETDLPDTSERVTVMVTLNESIAADRSGICLFGKEIAKAWSRDSGARIGEDVTVISGEITSGGSRNRWETIADEGTVLKIRNITRDALNIPTRYDVTVEEISEETKVDRKALEEEKARLLARLAEIEALLA